MAATLILVGKDLDFFQLKHWVRIHQPFYYYVLCWNVALWSKLCVRNLRMKAANLQKSRMHCTREQGERLGAYRTLNSISSRVFLRLTLLIEVLYTALRA